MKEKQSNGSINMGFTDLFVKMKKLDGASLIETIVAAVLFLLIFSIGMEMLSRVGALQAGSSAMMAEAELRACINDFSVADIAEGEYERDYSWGTITISVAPYREFEMIGQVTFTVHIERGNRTFSHRMLKYSQQ